jgi:hypothetical protein
VLLLSPSGCFQFRVALLSPCLAPFGEGYTVGVSVATSDSDARRRARGRAAFSKLFSKPLLLLLLSHFLDSSFLLCLVLQKPFHDATPRLCFRLVLAWTRTRPSENDELLPYIPRPYLFI